MRILVGVLGGVLVGLMLFEIFLAFLLPRRVKRDPKLARRVALFLYGPWKAVTRRLPNQIGDTLLGMYGPFGLLLDLALWVAALKEKSWPKSAEPCPEMCDPPAHCRQA